MASAGSGKAGKGFQQVLEAKAEGRRAKSRKKGNESRSKKKKEEKTKSSQQGNCAGESGRGLLAGGGDLSVFGRFSQGEGDSWNRLDSPDSSAQTLAVSSRADWAWLAEYGFL